MSLNDFLRTTNINNHILNLFIEIIRSRFIDSRQQARNRESRVLHDHHRIIRGTGCCGRCIDRTKRLFVVGTKGTLIPQYYRIVVGAIASILLISEFTSEFVPSNSTIIIASASSG